MADHDITHSTNIDDFFPPINVEVTTHASKVTLPPDVIARQIRDAFARTVAGADTFGQTSVTDVTPELVAAKPLVDLTQVWKTLVAKRNQSSPELNKPIRAYKRNERLGLLLAHDKAGFIATGLDELRDAFGLMHYMERGQTAEEKLDHIGGHAYEVAPRDDTEEERSDKVRKVASRVSQNYRALARHAKISQGRLEQARQAVTESIKHGEHYGSLAEYFGATMTPAYEGRGQLARFIDGAIMVAGVEEGHEGYALITRVAKDSKKRSVIADPSTNPELMTPELEQHQREILSLISMEDAFLWLGLAIDNDRRRGQFWEQRSAEAEHSDIVGAAGGTAVGSLIA